jgi:transcription antitermination factor NusG
VLEEVGISPENPPWPLTSKTGPPGLYRLIGKAFIRHKDPNSPLCLTAGKNRWALSRRGVHRALELQKTNPRRGGDRRDHPGWVVLELTKSGEQKIKDGTLVSTIRNDLEIEEDHPVFIPAVRLFRNNRPEIRYLIEGYAFVRGGLDDTVYFSLERRHYITQVMSTLGSRSEMRTLSVVDSNHIESLQGQLRQIAASGLSEGMAVVVRQGVHRHMEGKIILLGDGHAHVRIELRSMVICARIPRAHLEPANEWGV